MKTHESVVMKELRKTREKCIRMYETEQRVPPVEILGKIADFFNVSVDYLLGCTEMRNFCDLESYEKLVTQVRDFFKDDKIPIKEKEKFFRDVSDLFWQSKEKIKI
ncbi:MAG: hypothetical protein PWR14_793 [Thermosediminibacterales bacterium]|nr:hypothetical protein [Thermosediminibacterales bacterium]